MFVLIQVHFYTQSKSGDDFFSFWKKSRKSASKARVERVKLGSVILQNMLCTNTLKYVDEELAGCF